MHESDRANVLTIHAAYRDAQSRSSHRPTFVSSTFQAHLPEGLLANDQALVVVHP